MTLIEVMLISIACLLFMIGFFLVAITFKLETILECTIMNLNRINERIRWTNRFLRTINKRTYNFYEAKREQSTGGKFYMPYMNCIEDEDYEFKEYELKEE